MINFNRTKVKAFALANAIVDGATLSFISMSYKMLPGNVCEITLDNLSDDDVTTNNTFVVASPINRQVYSGDMDCLAIHIDRSWSAGNLEETTELENTSVPWAEFYRMFGDAITLTAPVIPTGRKPRFKVNDLNSCSTVVGGVSVNIDLIKNKLELYAELDNLFTTDNKTSENELDSSGSVIRISRARIRSSSECLSETMRSLFGDAYPMPGTSIHPVLTEVHSSTTISVNPNSKPAPLHLVSQLDKPKNS